MKYRALLRPHLFSMGGWGWCGVLVRDVVGGGERVGGGVPWELQFLKEY